MVGEPVLVDHHPNLGPSNSRFGLAKEGLRGPKKVSPHCPHTVPAAKKKVSPHCPHTVPTVSPLVPEPQNYPHIVPTLFAVSAQCPHTLLHTWRSTCHTVPTSPLTLLHTRRSPAIQATCHTIPTRPHRTPSHVAVARHSSSPSYYPHESPQISSHMAVARHSGYLSYHPH